MRFLPRLTIWLASLPLALVSVRAADPAPATARPIPVVLATDIGDDIDDTWALVHALRSPELDVKLVLTEYGAPRYRAALTAKLLQSAGRTDVAVGVGVGTTSPDDEKRNQVPWVDDYDPAKYPGTVHADGVKALLELVERSEQPVTVIAVGPTPSLAEAVRRNPEFARKCRLVGMYGSFDSGYEPGSAPSAEWNVKADVPSLRQVLQAPWREVLLTPLDTCGRITLSGDRYRRLWQAATTDPAVRAVIENYCLWAARVSWMNCDFFVTRSTTLFDDVAVYLAYSEGLVEVETVRFTLTDDGFTRRDAEGPFQARVALRWRDRDGFEAHLASRVLGEARR